MKSLHGTYDYRLVALSIMLAVCVSYSALDLAARVTAARGRSRMRWLSCGATAMGLGIWAMHYVGMLAFQLPVQVFYHYPTVLLSLLAAVLASAIALFTVSREHMGGGQAILASLFIGGGIAATHYIGMAAMRLPALMEYSSPRVVLSLGLAMAVSLAALTLFFQGRQEQKSFWWKVLSALIMGSTIPLVHYSGMWAVRFYPSSAPINQGHVVQTSLLGGAVITVTTFIVLTMVIVAAFMDRILTARNEALSAAQENLSQFRILAEAIPEVVWTATPDGLTDYCNKRWQEITGMTEQQTLGEGWAQMIHPDDLPVCLDEWNRSLRTGKTYQTEYRIKHADKNYCWHLVRATPVRDANGAIIKWFGTCTDIEYQKHYQQTLEQQIKERTIELAEANERLQEEMWERESARRSLDLQNEVMMRELRERSQRATLLAKMGEHLQSCITKEEVFAAALGFAPRVFPERRGAVALLNRGRNFADVIGSWADCVLSANSFDAESCWALRTGHPHLVSAEDATARCIHAEGVHNTYLCIPILAQGETLGILHFQTTDQAPMIAEAELSLQTTFAGQIGLSIANIRLREALRTQSIKDPLTGLYNRRYLEEALEREIRRAVRAKQSLGVLILDLDHFKRFNDTHGHDAGDLVLREAGVCLSKSVRLEDTVCRYGGEEFVVLLPTASVEAASERAEAIRSRMRELVVVHKGQSLGMITASIGVAAFPQHGTLPKDLLAAADAALYRAKEQGRDCIVRSEDVAQTVGEAAEASAKIQVQIKSAAV